MRPVLPVAIAVACALVLTDSSCGTRKREVPPAFRQLTDGSGDTNSPNLSPDGKLVVYVSDRAESGNADIWVQMVAGGPPVRLTNHPARDYDPVFSSDAKSVYFTSLREPQGIYRVSVSGGEAELVASGGVTPQVSPDGETLLFSSLGNIAVMNIREHASKFLVPDFDNSFGAKWSPDGGEIMFVGRFAKDDPHDWWIIKPDGTERRNTGLLAKLKQSGFTEAYLAAWTSGDRIVFAGKRGEQVTLWGFTLSPNHVEMVGDAVRVTDNDSGDDHAAYAAGHLVFDRTRVMLNLWSLPVDVNQAKVTGNLERLTSSSAQKGNASLSTDGKKLLYSMEKDGVYRLQLKDLRNGTEKEVGPTSTFYSLLSPDGLQFAYGLGPPEGIDVFTRAVSGWRSWWSHSVCERCGMPRGLAADMHSLLVWTDSDSNSHVDLVDLNSGKSRTILRDPSIRFYGPELSPDGNWASFIAKTGPHAFGSYIVRIPGDRPAMPSEWINVNPSSNDFQMAFWSTDGNLIYLLDTHGEGNLNWLNAQGLDTRTKRPIGVLKNVYHFQEPRVPSMDPIWNHPAAAAGRILLELGDMSTNIWIADAFQSGSRPLVTKGIVH